MNGGFSACQRSLYFAGTTIETVGAAIGRPPTISQKLWDFPREIGVSDVILLQNHRAIYDRPYNHI